MCVDPQDVGLGLGLRAGQAACSGMKQACMLLFLHHA